MRGAGGGIRRVTYWLARVVASSRSNPTDHRLTPERPEGRSVCASATLSKRPNGRFS